MQLNISFKKVLVILTLFSIAMGYLESAVVVYLRELYYPAGFSFPMVTLPAHIAITEIIRESSTMVMLISVALIAGENMSRRFAWFLYCFAIWDIFYYVFLKMLVNWPDSVLTWDILFLIPVVWTGPVITPVLVSLTMILLALQILLDKKIKIRRRSLWLIVAGAFLVFLSFIWDFSTYMIKLYSLPDLFNINVSQNALMQYVPQRFNWLLFICGELVIFTAIALPYIKVKIVNNK